MNEWTKSTYQTKTSRNHMNVCELKNKNSLQRESIGLTSNWPDIVNGKLLNQ